MTRSGLLEDDYFISLQDPMALKNHWLWCAIAKPRSVPRSTATDGCGPFAVLTMPSVAGVAVTASSSVISEYRDIYQGYLWWGVTKNVAICRPNEKAWGYAPKPFAVFLATQQLSSSAGAGHPASAYCIDGTNFTKWYDTAAPAVEPANCCQKSLMLTEFADGPVTIPAGRGLQIQSSAMRYGDWRQTEDASTPKDYTMTLNSRDNLHIDCSVKAVNEKYFTSYRRWKSELTCQMKRTLRFYYGSTPLDHDAIDTFNDTLPVGSVAAGGGVGAITSTSPYTTNELAPAMAIAYDGLDAMGIFDNEIFPDTDGVWRPAADTDVAWVLVTAGYHDDDIMQLTLTYTMRSTWAVSDQVAFNIHPQTLDVDVAPWAATPPRVWGLDYYDLRQGAAPRIVT